MSGSSLHRPLLPIALGAVTGCALGTFLHPLVWGAAAWVCVLLLIRRRTVALVLVGTVAAFGCWTSLSRDLEPALSAGTPVVLSGEVVQEPSWGPRGQVLVLETAERRVRVAVPDGAVWGDALPGARVVAVGRFVTGRPDRQVSEFRATEVRELEPGRGHHALWASARGGLRSALRSTGTREPFFRAVLLGERARLDPRTRRAFTTTGTVHLLSISGLHVGLLAGLVLLLLRGLGWRPKESGLAVVLVLLVYLALVGPRAPTLRATVAGVAFFLAPARGDAWNRLSLALLAVLVWDPVALWDRGLQLSFGTVAGMLVLHPVVFSWVGVSSPWDALTGHTWGGRARRWTRAAACSALVAFLASTPLLALTCGQLPLVVLLLGAPAILMFTIVLATALAGLALAVIFPPAGALLLGVASRLADLLVSLIEATAEVCPAETLTPPSPACAVLAVGILALGVARRRRWTLGLGLLLLLALVLPRPPEVEAGASRLVLDRRRGALHSGPGARAIPIEAAGRERSPEGSRILRLEGGVLVFVGGRRVLWVRNLALLRRDLATLPLVVDVVVSPRRVDHRALRALYPGSLILSRSRDTELDMDALDPLQRRGRNRL